MLSKFTSSRLTEDIPQEFCNNVDKKNFGLDFNFTLTSSTRMSITYEMEKISEKFSMSPFRQTGGRRMESRHFTLMKKQTGKSPF